MNRASIRRYGPDEEFLGLTRGEGGRGNASSGPTVKRQLALETAAAAAAARSAATACWGVDDRRRRGGWTAVTSLITSRARAVWSSIVSVDTTRAQLAPLYHRHQSAICLCAHAASPRRSLQQQREKRTRPSQATTAAALIAVSSALSQTPVYTARPLHVYAQAFAGDNSSCIDTSVSPRRV